MPLIKSIRKWIDESLSDIISKIINFIKYLIYFAVGAGILIFLLCALPKIDIYSDSSALHNVENLYYASIIIFTLFLVVMGWIQFSKLNRIGNGDYLLRLYMKYGSTEIIRARAIIQRIYRESNPDDDNPVSRDVYMRKMHKRINEIRLDPTKSLQFSMLINLLDYLEVISYFANNGYIDEKDVDELIGNSFIFYYNVFEDWIYDRRSRYHNPTYYIEFEKLVYKIKKSKRD